MHFTPRRHPIVPLLAGIGSVWLCFHGTASHSQAPVGGNPATSAVPVSAITAEYRDVPVTQEGLGTVQAFNTVTIRPQVDGQLIKITFKEGQDLHVGDVLAQIDPRTYQAALDQALAKKAQDEAQLANARIDLQRYRGLVEKNYVARQQLDTTSAQVNQLEAAVQGDNALIDNARVMLGYTTIKSPIDGRAGFRLTDIGNIVHASDPTGIVVVTQVAPIFVVFTLPEDHLPQVVKAMVSGPLSTQALSRDGSETLDEGVLAFVDNQIDQSSGTIRLKAVMPNTAGRLWPGQFINARLRIETLRHVVTVPAPAVQRGPQGTFIYVVKADSTVEARPVRLGEVSEGLAVIDGGLAEGEKVVTAGQYRLQPGARVEVAITSTDKAK